MLHLTVTPNADFHEQCFKTMTDLSFLKHFSDN